MRKTVYDNHAQVAFQMKPTMTLYVTFNIPNGMGNSIFADVIR